MKIFLTLIICFIIFSQALFGISSKQLPKELEGVPFGEDIGLITHVKKIDIPLCKCAYNPSLIAYGDHYKLFFRLDTPTVPPFISQIGVVSLDENFDSYDRYSTLSTNSHHSEDPRAFWHNDNIYVSYSQTYSGSNPRTAIHLAKLNPQTIEVEEIYNFDLGTKVEKNWSPFSADNVLKFIYFIHPQKVLSVNEDNTLLTGVLAENGPPLKRTNFWKKCYGQIRGGTPGIQISEDEFLAFFHSSFNDKNGFRWYVMGAYTFSTKAPHKILRVSQKPILFHSIYDSWTYQRNKFCIFPSGVVVKDNQVHVACGENDTAIKIVTFDREKLLQSLVEAVPIPRHKFSRLD